MLVYSQAHKLRGATGSCASSAHCGCQPGACAHQQEVAERRHFGLDLSLGKPLNEEKMMVTKNNHLLYHPIIFIKYLQMSSRRSNRFKTSKAKIVNNFFSKTSKNRNQNVT